MEKLYQVTDTNTDLQGQEDGFSVGDKDGEGVRREVLSEGSEWFQSLQADLEAEQRSEIDISNLAGKKKNRTDRNMLVNLKPKLDL